MGEQKKIEFEKPKIKSKLLEDFPTLDSLMNSPQVKKNHSKKKYYKEKYKK